MAAGTCGTDCVGPAQGPAQCSVCFHFLLQHSQALPGGWADKMAWSLALQAELGHLSRPLPLWWHL